MSQEKWIPLEANPDVINGYIESLGFPTALYKFVDVFSYEDWALDMLAKPVLGFLLLYKISPLSREALRRRLEPEHELSPNIYYMIQTISNACGTIGLMHIIGNCVYSEGIPLAEGSFLERFMSKSLGMTPQERGAELENGDNSEVIEAAHKRAASSGQSRVPGAHEKVDLHFVAIIPKDSGIYEMDGRAGKPIFHGNFEVFERDACQRVICNEFINVDTSTLSYTILALVPNTEY